MGNVLAKAARVAAGAVGRLQSVAIDYYRGDEVIEGLAVRLGRTRFQVDGGYGIEIKWTDRDFVIAPEDLVLSGVRITPQRGDQIRQVEGSITHVFEVLSPGNEQCYRLDPNGASLRIHTKLIEDM